jgi:hypothetical protein
MFGHQDKKDDEQSSQEENVIAPDQPAEHAAGAETPDHAAPAHDAPDTPDDADPAPAPAMDTPADDKPADDTADSGWQHPGAPLDDDDEDDGDKEDDSKSPAPIEDIVGTNAGPNFKPFPQPSHEFHGGNQDTENTPHELIDVKQKALEDLGPLVGKLDQSPEDKFRTLMMMIQASDDQSLIQSAYKAAHEIKDDKVRAQALLDVVNEINYFTQHPEN